MKMSHSLLVIIITIIMYNVVMPSHAQVMDPLSPGILGGPLPYQVTQDVSSSSPSPPASSNVSDETTGTGSSSSDSPAAATESPMELVEEEGQDLRMGKFAIKTMNTFHLTLKC